MSFRYYILVVCAVLIYFSQPVLAQLDIPDPPVLLSASVNSPTSNNELILNWIPSDSLDVEGYIIYQVIGGITETIDTVFGRSSDTYFNMSSNASMQSETYRMAAFDTIENKSMITNPHTTIFLDVIYEQCAQECTISWTPYQGYESGVEEHLVYRKTQGGSYTIVGTTGGNETSYIDENILPNVEHCYYVEAVNEDAVFSASNFRCAFSESYLAPEFINADYASVVDNSVELSFTIGDGGETNEYRLLKSANKEYGFFEIATIPNTGQTNIQFIDDDVQVDKTIFYYKLVSVDPCGNNSAESNVSSNIILEVTGDGNLYLNHYLDWTSYEDYLGDVQDYRIYRVFTNGAPVLFYETGFTDNSFTDNIAWWVNFQHDGNKHVTDRYCYIVEAVENQDHNPWGIKGTSRSNMACYQQKPLVWLPNVFNPGSYSEKNRVFKPVLSFVSAYFYEFIILDRFGLPIFSTNNTSEGWNGVLDENRAPDNTYMYYIKYVDFDNEEYIHTGKFLLITN